MYGENHARVFQNEQMKTREDFAKRAVAARDPQCFGCSIQFVMYANLSPFAIFVCTWRPLKEVENVSEHSGNQLAEQAPQDVEVQYPLRFVVKLVCTA